MVNAGENTGDGHHGMVLVDHQQLGGGLVEDVGGDNKDHTLRMFVAINLRIRSCAPPRVPAPSAQTSHANTKQHSVEKQINVVLMSSNRS